MKNSTDIWYMLNVLTGGILKINMVGPALSSANSYKGEILTVLYLWSAWREMFTNQMLLKQREDERYWKHITHVHVTDIGEWLYWWHIGDCGLFQFFPYVCFRSGPILKIMSNQGFWSIRWDALEIQSTSGVGDVIITHTGFSPGLPQQSWWCLSQNALSLGQWLSNFSLQINHLEAH